MAYYDGANVAIVDKYFNEKSINKAMKQCEEEGFHPSRGNKTAMQALVYHELGHALTDVVNEKFGGRRGTTDLLRASTKIVTEARKQTKHRGNVIMASKISRYATHTDAEAIAEAFTDVMCNGSRAHAESKAIVNVLEKYLK